MSNVFLRSRQLFNSAIQFRLLAFHFLFCFAQLTLKTKHNKHFPNLLVLQRVMLFRLPLPATTMRRKFRSEFEI